MTSAEQATVRSGERANISDPAVMRALAHPARLEVLEHLSLNPDGATATECADVVGLSPSAMSYHLRALAKVGLIHEGPSRGDGRERVWQASHQGYSVAGDHDASPEQIEAEKVVSEAMLARQNDKVRQYLGRLHSEPREWFDAVFLSDVSIEVTADELKELIAQISALIEPLRSVHRRPPPPNTRRVSIQLRGIPVD